MKAAIHYDADRRLFHLQGGAVSYVVELIEGSYPAHVYWGPRLAAASPQLGTAFRERPSFSPTLLQARPVLTLDTLPQEYPAHGAGDFRAPAYEARLADGTSVTEAVYESHRILGGKPALAGLPAVYVESEDEALTLELTLRDAYSGLAVILSYTVFAEHAAVARSVRFANGGSEPLELEAALSASIDFKTSDYDFLHLDGRWAMERGISRSPLQPGTQSIGSRRGSSSHNHNPFFALLGRRADEEQGDAYGFSLVYSGSFLGRVETEQYGMSRAQIGIHPDGFSWRLEPGAEFQAPECVLVYSAEGLGGMSRAYHRLYRSRLCRGTFRDRERPVLINNWEATYFNFTADKIAAIAREGGKLGIELFVLDDGWFGRRDRDDSSLGDWKVDLNKLPEGLGDLAERVRAEGLQFGLWFEPEMVSPDSDLYRQHPDWCLHVPGRRRSEGRRQLILDFSREEVADAIAEQIESVLASAPITYVKWDMNRNMTEIGSAALPPERQRETAHRYMLGLYRVLDRITAKFPHVLFESCSGGGGRFDPGMLYYMPQTWTSDNTDAVSRLRIQYGTSVVYPISSMGAHISAVPNHQVGRVTSLKMRGDVAMSGNFGYELDLTKFSEEEAALAAAQVAFYKDIRSLVQFGDLYRLLSPFEGEDAAWMIVSPDRREAIAFHFRVLAQPNPPIGWLKLRGLDPALEYEAVEIDLASPGAGESFRVGGDVLMHAGLALADRPGDFQSLVWRLRA
ncbi:Alpha-galactosidase [Paenibacillus pasadenensis]|uniref:Alpha-galactosidase n=1 Tax=Paenibacillus pasadenensis TaxID=217090 RepID=A0A2N5N2U8_9BACL|nr:alpha-galactosidase [Paenibacillus pasadenensis]PLT44661.1 Alpha-galactosidase [Paenibacillus pasadenensis]